MMQKVKKKKKKDFNLKPIISKIPHATKREKWYANPNKRTKFGEMKSDRTQNHDITKTVHEGQNKTD